MPYPQNSSQLEDMISRAFDDPAVHQIMESAGANEPQLRTFLKSQAPDIWASAAKEIADFNVLEASTTALQAKKEQIKRRRSVVIRFVDDILPGIGGSAFLALFALFSSYVRTKISYVYTNYLANHWLVTAAIIFSLLALVVGLYRRKKPNYAKSLSAIDEELSSASQNIDTARSEVDQRLIANGIRPAALEFLNKLQSPTFSLSLSEADTSGLAEVQNTHFEISTPARGRLIGLMDEMRAGSIGIAGPRGAGKTTLLWALYEEAAANPRELSAFTSAPVQYEPRDFLLHLFTSVCTSVLQKVTGDANPPMWTDFKTIRSTRPPVLDFFFRSPATTSSTRG